jgi:hypothetical protein
MKTYMGHFGEITQKNTYLLDIIKEYENQIALNNDKIRFINPNFNGNFAEYARSFYENAIMLGIPWSGSFFPRGTSNSSVLIVDSAFIRNSNYRKSNNLDDKFDYGLDAAFLYKEIKELSNKAFELDKEIKSVENDLKTIPGDTLENQNKRQKLYSEMMSMNNTYNSILSEIDTLKIKHSNIKNSLVQLIYLNVSLLKDMKIAIYRFKISNSPTSKSGNNIIRIPDIEAQDNISVVLDVFDADRVIGPNNDGVDFRWGTIDQAKEKLNQINIMISGTEMNRRNYVGKFLNPNIGDFESYAISPTGNGSKFSTNADRISLLENEIKLIYDSVKDFAVTADQIAVYSQMGLSDKIDEVNRLKITNKVIEGNLTQMVTFLRKLIKARDALVKEINSVVVAPVIATTITPSNTSETTSSSNTSSTNTSSTSSNSSSSSTSVSPPPSPPQNPPVISTTITTSENTNDEKTSIILVDSPAQILNENTSQQSSASSMNNKEKKFPWWLIVAAVGTYIYMKED